MSKRDREQFEAQRRVRSFFAVFSWGVGGVGVGELEVSGANFFLEEESCSTWHFESSEIDDRHHEQARHNFSDDAGLVVAAQSSLRHSPTKPRGTAELPSG